MSAKGSVAVYTQFRACVVSCVEANGLFMNSRRGRQKGRMHWPAIQGYVYTVVTASSLGLRLKPVYGTGAPKGRRNQSLDRDNALKSAT